MIKLDDNEIYWWRPLDGEAEPDTRDKILFAAYKEIHVNGFQAASLNNILSHTGVTKGALYHHFPNKTELGYAVLEEVISKRVMKSFVSPLEQADDPIEALVSMVSESGHAFSLRDIELGCPLTNLAQEMAPIDEGFRHRLDAIYLEWHGAIERAMIRASEKGLVRDDVDPEQVAIMMVATLEGCLNVGMITQDVNKLLCCGGGLIQYLNLIRKH